LTRYPGAICQGPVVKKIGDPVTISLDVSRDGENEAMAKRCAQCGQERDSISTVDLFAQAQGVDAELIGFPYRSCSAGHEKTYVYPDFGSDLREFIFGGAIPQTKKAGLLGRGESCAGCGARLAWIRTPQLEFRVEPRLRDAPPFELVLRMPAIACANCLTLRARASTFGKRVNPLDAILAAFQAGGISPT
jgi:hypothetical protein